MAAFCSCCGSEITLKTEACALCGMPRHGMGSGAAKVALKASAPRATENLPEGTVRTANRALCFVGC